MKQNLTVVRVVGINYPDYPNYCLFFRETPPPLLKMNLNGNYPNYLNYHLFFRGTPLPTLKVNLNGNYPYYPNYRLFFRETPPPPLKMNLMATTLTTSTTVCFSEGPHSTHEAESDGS